MKKHPSGAEDAEDAAVSCHHSQHDLPEAESAVEIKGEKTPQVYAYTFLGFLLLIANLLSIAASNNLFSTKSSQIARPAHAADSSQRDDSIYFLPADSEGQNTTWAYSDYSPGLETNVVLESEDHSSNAYTIGSWLDTSTLPRRIVIIKLGSSYLMTSTYRDGSVETAPLIPEVMTGEERLYKDAGNIDGSYMVIRPNGNLAFYTDAGFIYELSPQ